MDTTVCFISRLKNITALHLLTYLGKYLLSKKKDPAAGASYQTNKVIQILFFSSSELHR